MGRRLSILLLAFASTLACKHRGDSTSLKANPEKGNDVWPEACDGSVTTFSESNLGLTFETDGLVPGKRFISKKLKHYEGLKKLVVASKENNWPLCINDIPKEGSAPFKVTALDIGLAQKLVVGTPAKKKFPHRVNNFAISSEGGINVVVNRRKFGCPSNTVGWGEPGIYDGLSITKLLIDGYKDGISDKTLDWMENSFCQHLQPKNAAKEVWPEECDGTVVSVDKRANGLLFTTDGAVKKTMLIDSSLPHFQGLNLMLAASKEFDFPLCINKQLRDAAEPLKITALDIGSAQKLVRQGQQPRVNPQTDNIVQKFELSSAGGIRVTVNGTKYGCPANTVGWQKTGLYDGVKITKTMIDGYRNGLSDETVAWMRKSFCIHVNLRK